jgi:hypothetical protein
MKYFLLAFVVLMASCQKTEPISEFTGSQAIYSLMAGSAYDVNGTVTFKERKDGTTTVAIELSGTSGESKLPVHLHLGNISTPDAPIALLLSPVTSTTGKSETIITTLADDSKVTYKELLSLAACVKVHLADFGAGKDVILAAGNIGANGTAINSRAEVAVCQ